MTFAAVAPHTRRSRMWPTRLAVNHVAKLTSSVWATIVERR